MRTCLVCRPYSVALCVIALLGAGTASSADVIFSAGSKTAQILAIERIQERDATCKPLSMSGVIQKVTGKYPEIEVWVQGRRSSVAFQMSLPNFNMASIRALPNFLRVGARVVVDIEYCGSGAIPYPLAIRLDQG